MSRSCWLLFAFVARAVAEEYETEFPPSPAPISTDGESVCEGHGYDATACEEIGCCCFDGGKCWSAVGRGACYDSGTPDCDDEDEDFDFMESVASYLGIPIVFGIAFYWRRYARDRAAAAKALEYGLTSSAPDALILSGHRQSEYNGRYTRAGDLWNNRPHYVNEQGCQFYFYAVNEGGAPGWSLDARTQDETKGAKDWCDGGWFACNVDTPLVPPLGPNLRFNDAGYLSLTRCDGVVSGGVAQPGPLIGGVSGGVAQPGALIGGAVAAPIGGAVVAPVVGVGIVKGGVAHDAHPVAPVGGTVVTGVVVQSGAGGPISRR